MTNKQVTNSKRRTQRPSPADTNSGYRPQLYKSPIDMPEAACGKVRIRHRQVPVGEVLPVVGMRQALVRGIMQASYRTKAPMVIHELVHEDHGCWMTDNPEELNQIAEMLHDVNPTGRVLVGGLGLGILASTLAEREGVESVTVVEIDPDVATLCARPGYELVVQDLREFLENTPSKFDCYVLDTWQATNEGTWWSTVMPLRRLIRRRWGNRPTVHCWAEDIMRGQILRSLTTKPPHWYYDGLPMPMSQGRAIRFLDGIGTPEWEKEYGATIDRTLADRAREES